MRRNTSSSKGCARLNMSLILNNLLRLNIISHLFFKTFWTSVGFLTFFVNNLGLIFFVKNLGLDTLPEIATIGITWSLIILYAHLVMLILSRFFYSLFFLIHSFIITNFLFNSWFNPNKIFGYSIFPRFIPDLIMTLLHLLTCHPLTLPLKRLFLIRKPRQWPTPIPLLLRCRCNSNSNPSPRIPRHPLYLPLLLPPSCLIPQSIFLCLNLLLEKHILVIQLNYLGLLFSINSFLLFFRVFRVFRRFIKGRGVGWIKGGMGEISVAWFVAVGVAGLLMGGGGAGVRHWDIVLTWFEVSDRWILLNVFSTCVCETLCCTIGLTILIIIILIHIIVNSLSRLSCK